MQKNLKNGVAIYRMGNYKVDFKKRPGVSFADPPGNGIVMKIQKKLPGLVTTPPPAFYTRDEAADEDNLRL